MGRILVLGSLNADLVVRVQRLPAPGETLTGEDLETYPGGKGANQALAAARLGAPVALAGAVGPDAFGDLLLRSQQEAGVDCSLVRRAERPTGVALIAVLPDGDNSILLSPGANRSVTPQQAQAACSGLGPGDLLLCQLEIPLECVAAALRAARAAGATTMLDPAPAQPLGPDVLGWADILTPNETEAAALTGLSAQADPVDLAQLLHDKGAQTVVFKRGDRGSFTALRDEGWETPAFPVQAVDATAAGDVFNAALACGLLRGSALRDAVKFANAASAVSVTRRGAQPSAPTAAEVQAFLASAR